MPALEWPKAQWVPQISLTSLGSSASSQLQSMFAGKYAYWYAAGSLSEPIFDAGRLRSNYHLSQAQEQEMLLDYQKTILNALKDLSDSLVGYKETRERREQQAALTLSAVALLAVWLPATGAEKFAYGTDSRRSRYALSPTEQKV